MRALLIVPVLAAVGGWAEARPAPARAEVVAVEAPARLRVAVFPFTVRGVEPDAWPRLRESLAIAFPRRGLEIVDQASVDLYLRERRLRDASTLRREEVAGLAGAVRADRVLVGNLYTFREEPEPAVGFSGRLIDPERLRLEAVSITVVEGRELAGLLGAGGPVTMPRVLDEASGRFAAALTGDGRHQAPDVSPLAPQAFGWVAPEFGEETIRRVVVLPFENRTRRAAAGEAAAEAISSCLLAASDLSLMEPGDATRRLLQLGWRIGHPVGAEQVLALGKDPGVDAVLMGSVERWEEADASGIRPPEIALSARLLSARTGALLWTATHERRGDQTRTVYENGNVRMAEALMVRSAAEILRPLTRSLARASRLPPSKEKTR